MRTINSCIYNINSKISNWLPTLTGPTVFSNSINFVLKNKSKINLYKYKDEVLNYAFNRHDSASKCRFFGSDYDSFCSYDNGCKDILLKDSIYWHYDKEIFN